MLRRLEILLDEFAAVLAQNSFQQQHDETVVGVAAAPRSPKKRTSPMPSSKMAATKQELLSRLPASSHFATSMGLCGVQ